MDPDELLRLLDLGATPPPPTPQHPPPGTPTGPPGTPSPTALEIDAWGMRRGRDLLSDHAALRAAGVTGEEAADFFAAAFDPDPRLAPDCADPRRRAFVTGLLAAPDARLLREQTRLDDAASEVAAAHFALRYARLGKEADAAENTAEPAAIELKAEVAASRATAGARGEVAEFRAAVEALGARPGGAGIADPRAAAELFRRVRADPALRRVCDLAGRFRRVARSRQSRKATDCGGTSGVTLGGDIGRLVPAELARLALPELELDALLRLSEGRSLSWDRTGREPVGRGPVVVCCDESGSMEGGRSDAAKALALALAWVAGHQNRWCALVAYSGDTGERLLALPPGRRDPAAVLTWLSGFLGGGSSIDVPVRELPRMFADLGAPRGRTDAVFVTDALCRLPEAVRRDFLAWKQSARVRLTTLVVGGAGPGDLAAASDECHRVNDLSPDSPEAGRVLSL